MTQHIVTIINVMTGDITVEVCNSIKEVGDTIDSIGPNQKFFVNQTDEEIQIPVRKNEAISRN